MTIAVDLGRKATKQPTNQPISEDGVSRNEAHLKASYSAVQLYSTSSLQMLFFLIPDQQCTFNERLKGCHNHYIDAVSPKDPEEEK